ncbi:hypothetical protein CP8484711_0671B, partial [Chlamydia psittaci 84-8471/1]
NIRN